MIPIAYKNYLQIKKIFELLSKDELSISDIQDKLGLPQSTAFKKMKDLRTLGVIEVTKYRLVHGMRREALYRKVVEQ